MSKMLTVALLLQLLVLLAAMVYFVQPLLEDDPMPGEIWGADNGRFEHTVYTVGNGVVTFGAPNCQGCEGVTRSTYRFKQLYSRVSDRSGTPQASEASAEYSGVRGPDKGGETLRKTLTLNL